MLQLQTIRQNPQAIKERLAVKNFTEINLVDEIILLDEEIRHLKKRIEDAQMQINSKSISPYFFARSQCGKESGFNLGLMPPS